MEHPITAEIPGLSYETNVSADLPLGEQPQERFESFGAGALSDAELLALAMFGVVKKDTAMQFARSLIAQAGSMRELATWSVMDFERAGVPAAKCVRLAILPEIARRMMSASSESNPVLNRADLVSAHMQAAVLGLQVEKFWVLCLDRKNRLIKRVEITSGTATSALAHPREVFRAAIQHGACAIICCHNHPSGDPSPSAPDVQVTRLLRDAAKAIDIQLVDHVVIGRAAADPTGKGHYSFREAGMV